MSLVVPLSPFPSQVVSTTVDGQQVTLTLRQLSTGLYANVVSNNAEVVGLVICENENRIVRNGYLGLQGDFIFVDTQGEDDPYFTGLGSRFQLVYLSAAELAGTG